MGKDEFEGRETSTQQTRTIPAYSMGASVGGDCQDIARSPRSLCCTVAMLLLSHSRGPAVTALARDVSA